LLLKVAQDHPLDRNCGCRDCAPPKEARDETESEATEPTKKIATATPNAATLQFSPKD